MKSNPRVNRKKLRLLGYDYSLPGAYFITACAEDREFLFATAEATQAVEWAWHSLYDVFGGIELDEFVVMPNHIHGIVWILADGAYRLHPGTWKAGATEKPLGSAGQPTGPTPKGGSRTKLIYLANIVGAFKTSAATRINALSGQKGALVWQRSYYDHVVRSEVELRKIREYIRYNPLNWEQDRDDPIHPSFA